MGQGFFNSKESVIAILFYLMIGFIILLDQVTKYWIRNNLDVGDTIVVWEGILHFTNYQNSGAAFGLFRGYGRLFVPVAVIISAVSIFMLEKGYLSGKLTEVGIAFFIGGAIGNAIDRTLFNQVTDFIKFQFHRTIFNLADIALFIGVIFLLIDAVIMDCLKEMV